MKKINPVRTDIVSIYNRDPIEAKKLLMSDLVGYLKVIPVQKILEMMSIDEQFSLYEFLNTHGANLDINQILDEVEPYHALDNVYDYIDYGVDIEKLADKIFADEDFDAYFEIDAIEELLDKGADPVKMFQRCMPFIEHNEFDDEVKEFLYLFKGRIPNKLLEPYFKRLES